MKKYFKFIGCVELVCWLIGLICYIISMVQSFKVINEPTAIFYSILILIIIIVVGPALGLLFIHVGSEATNKEQLQGNKPQVIEKPNNKAIEKEKEVVSTEEMMAIIQEKVNSETNAIIQNTKEYHGEPTKLKYKYRRKLNKIKKENIK